MKRITDICKHHGETLFLVEPSGRTRCVYCRTDATLKRKFKIRQMAIEYKGGCCQNCGYNKYSGALEFHHLNPEEKDFSLTASSPSRSFDRVKKELDKCILLCSNCHREEHDKIRNTRLKKVLKRNENL